MRNQLLMRASFQLCKQQRKHFQAQIEQGNCSCSIRHCQQQMHPENYKTEMIENLSVCFMSHKLWLFKDYFPKIFLGSDKEKFLFQPGDKIYEKVGKEMVAASASVELFVCPSQYSDVASMAHVCHLTGGTLYKYTVSYCMNPRVIISEFLVLQSRKRSTRIFKWFDSGCDSTNCIWCNNESQNHCWY